MRAAGDANQGLRTLSFFPALESDVAAYQAGHPATALRAVYLTGGSPEADFPYVALRAPWVDAVHRAASEQLRRYLIRPEAERVFAAAGLRALNRTAGTGFPTSDAVARTLNSPALPIGSGTHLTTTIAQWQQNRPAAPAEH